MINHPERLDLQLRRARLQRDWLRFGVPVGLLCVIVALYVMWRLDGWHWWYVPTSLVSFALGLWFSRLEDEVIYSATRWIWRAPK